MKLIKKTRIILILIIIAMVFFNTPTALAKGNAIHTNVDEISTQAFSVFSLVVIVAGTVIVVLIMAISIISHKRQKKRMMESLRSNYSDSENK